MVFVFIIDTWFNPIQNGAAFTLETIFVIALVWYVALYVPLRLSYDPNYFRRHPLLCASAGEGRAGGSGDGGGCCRALFVSVLRCWTCLCCCDLCRDRCGSGGSGSGRGSRNSGSGHGASGGGGSLGALDDTLCCDCCPEACHDLCSASSGSSLVESAVFISAIPPELATFDGLMNSVPGRRSFTRHLCLEFSVEVCAGPVLSVAPPLLVILPCC
jgi:hypothetical protein